MSGLTAKCLVLLLLGLVPIGLSAQGAEPSERETIYRRYYDFSSYVTGGSIQPHWLSDGSRFWFAEGRPDNTIVWMVDPIANTKTPLFDTGRLRDALRRMLGHEPPNRGLPFTGFEFLAGDSVVTFTVEDKDFVLPLSTYQLTHAPEFSGQDRSTPEGRALRTVGQAGSEAGEVLSPDGRWLAAIRGHNLWLRSSDDSRNVQVTTDGAEDYSWHEGYPGMPPKWSPDSRHLAVRKIDFRETPHIPLVHYLDQQERVEWTYYPRAGERRAVSELFIVDIESGQKVRVDSGEEPAHYPVLWRPDGSELLFLRVARYRQRLELIAAEVNTGSMRRVIMEADSAGISFPFRQPETMITLLADGRRFIWVSERDGWNHLYLYDLDGTLIRRLTGGSFAVVRVVAVDEQAGWVYFTAQSDPDRPYDTHLCRVTLNGRRFEQLTHAPGHHDVQLMPSNQFFLDTHSSVDRPPVVELRTADGSLLQIVSQADTSALMRELRWRPPEEFVVKAADGQTDLHGVLYKPYDFDPRRSYPIIQTFGTPREPPRTFTPGVGLGFGIHALSMAHLGYIAVSVNGRGTRGRGAAFAHADRDHLGRLETADRVAALRQLAETRPFMDLTRVGVLGGSYPGFMAIRAMLFAPDVYSVGVAINPITDMAAHWRNEWASPEDNREAYEYASNLRFAANLTGRLLLIAGTSDRDVPVSHTMRMAEALIQARRPFDMLILPGQPHVPGGASRSAMAGAIRRYFEQHLRPE